MHNDKKLLCSHKNIYYSLISISRTRDISKSWKFKASFWIKNTFWLHSPSISWRWGLFFTSPNYPSANKLALWVILTWKKQSHQLQDIESWLYFSLAISTWWRQYAWCYLYDGLLVWEKVAIEMTDILCVGLVAQYWRGYQFINTVVRGMQWALEIIQQYA